VHGSPETPPGEQAPPPFPERLRKLAAEVEACMLGDRRALRKQLARLRRGLKAQTAPHSVLRRLEELVRASKQVAEARRLALPSPRFLPDLPVVGRRDDIAAAIAGHQVVVVCGETGSGKTTQLPKICLSLGRGVTGMIAHTQPRRIAARSAAARIAEELGSDVGRAVGYKVRFSDRVSAETYIKVVTDGMLLAETQQDRWLEQYDTVILDEAHERSLNIDFLLGYLKRLLPRRPELKVVITSATIDPGRFARHFDGAPVVEVSGRTYPVEVRYRPLEAQGDDEQDRDLEQAILDAVDELSAVGPGDILIFLPGEREIRETAESLRKHHPPHTEVLPLYARLSAAEQQRVFQDHPGRRIVLATNVAETSLTVPRVRFVIDPGSARISRYSHRSKVQRLPVEAVSRASADQRKGRCGRVAAGVCIRLYSRQAYDLRPAATEPEILRTNLAAVILQMKFLGLGEVEAFPFLDPPDSRLVKDGYQTLRELGALDALADLTEVGRQLARLPVDPRIGRMIIAAQQHGCLREVLVIASGLSVQDPRERPLDAQQQADQAHQRFRDERSDFLSYLKLWQDFAEQSRHLSTSKLRRFCRDHFLAYVRMREWRDIHQQLHAVVKDMGFRENEVPAGYEAIHRALLPGLLGHVAARGEGGEYQGVRGARLQLFPGSALFRKGPKWVVAAELVETGRLYARTVAGVQPEWVEQAAGHLVRRGYLEPHWEKASAQVAAYERVTLYGLTLVPKRRVNYGPIDPETSRRIFIRAALVQGEYRSSAPFLEHNRALVEDIESLEARVRRRDLLADEETMFRFYDQRVPEGIYSGPEFERWRQAAERERPRLLFMSREDLTGAGAAPAGPEQFPDSLMVGGLPFDLEYRFEPGDPADGVTLRIPIAALNQLDPAVGDWLVPGLLRDRVIALIRSLPKSLRRNFAPAPEFADACLPGLTAGAQPLTRALAAALHRITGVEVPPDAWQADALPEHLKMNFRVLDLDGRELGAGRDLRALQQALGGEAQRSFRSLPIARFERTAITRWDFGELPAAIEVQRDGASVRAYAALVEEGDFVALRLFDSAQEAEDALRAGLGRLFLLQSPKERKFLERDLPGLSRMCLDYASLGGCGDLRSDLARSVVERAFLEDGPLPRTAEAFEQAAERGRARLVSMANDTCRLVGEILARYRQASARVAAIASAHPAAASDLREQLGHLVYPGFVSATPHHWLQQLPRYLKAIELRLDKLRLAPSKDAQRLAEFAPLWHAYLERLAGQARRGISDAGLRDYRWMLEELRVSLFAQEVKTSVPVSVQRLRKQWERIPP
jgi:ATP-dependent helicase HrpA